LLLTEFDAQVRVILAPYCQDGETVELQLVTDVVWGTPLALPGPHRAAHDDSVSPSPKVTKCVGFHTPGAIYIGMGKDAKERGETLERADGWNGQRAGGGHA
jgi:hypothetical protein